MWNKWNIVCIFTISHAEANINLASNQKSVLILFKNLAQVFRYIWNMNCQYCQIKNSNIHIQFHIGILTFLQNLCHIKVCYVLIKPVLNYGLRQKYGFHITKPGRPEDGSSIFLLNIGTHPHTVSKPTRPPQHGSSPMRKLQISYSYCYWWISRILDTWWNLQKRLKGLLHTIIHMHKHIKLANIPFSSNWALCHEDVGGEWLHRSACSWPQH
jgi:hypothetical protein